MRDGFHFWAFLLAPLWMLRHRLWLELIAYLLLLGGVDVRCCAASAIAGDARASGSGCSSLALLVGMEASSLLRWKLSRRALRAGSASWSAMTAKRPSGVSSTAGRTSRRGLRLWHAASALAVRTAADDLRACQRRRRPVPAAGGAAMTVAIVDYGSGNLHSAAKAFERAARESGHDQPILVTDDPDKVRAADRVVLPGVGAFADCRRGLDAVPGMVEALNETVRQKGRPFLGICVGMQLMAERGREYEVVEGLGWIPGEVDRIAPSDREPEDPAHGLEHAQRAPPHPLLDGIPLGADGLHGYFVHSYHLNTDKASLVADADYGGAGHRDRGARQLRRHAIPSREEPAAGSGADRQFPEVEAVMHTRCYPPLEGRVDANEVSGGVG